MEKVKTFFNQRQLNKAVTKLERKHFQRFGICDFSQVWKKNNITIILVKGV